MPRPVDPVSLIAKKRDGGSHSASEIGDLIDGLLSGSVTDYQMSAWLMAAYLNGLDASETSALTDAMLHSGRVLALRSVSRPKVDKHSTGGVGDKISICLGPLVAACGVAVPMISGRGLGHTGGTLDKLEAIEGYRTRLDEREFERVVREVGVSIIGQTDRLAPADRRIYALRDVTGTVASTPLIVASILSKKLAEGIDGLVLDVKVGRGAFMTDLRSARALARALVDVGTRAGKQVTALLTDMSPPLGRMIGNALEIREAIDVLHGTGPADCTELTVELGAEMLQVAGIVERRADGRKRLRHAIDTGAGLETFAKMVAAHGGDATCAENPARLPKAPRKAVVPAPKRGTVREIDSRALGELAIELGAGRRHAEDDVDPRVGIEIVAPVGSRVDVGDPLALLHLSRRAVSSWTERARSAFEIGRRRADRRELVLGRVRPH